MSQTFAVLLYLISQNLSLNGIRTHEIAIPSHRNRSSIPSSHYMIFIYSYSHVFTIIGYMINSQLTIYPRGLVDRTLQRYGKVMPYFNNL